MKLFKFLFIVLTGVFTCMSAASQNALINILTQNSGMVKKKGTVFLEITVNNTDPTSSIGIYKIKTQISFPESIVSIPDTGHVLPPGWTITSNTGSVIYLSNGTDSVAPYEARTILIAMKGKTPGGPSTISGNLLFSNGNPPGTDPGSLKGDNPADNSSTSTIMVFR